VAEPDARVLVIGLDPHRVPGPWDPEPVAAAIERGLARFRENGVGVRACLVGLDGDDDVESIIASALEAGSWECVVIGGGIRDASLTALFESVVNLVRELAPGAAIAFNSAPDDTFEAASRWIPPNARRTDDEDATKRSEHAAEDR
jgi:hypothetical protein